MGKVMVGMSGGVDSSVAALLLQEQGHEVVGVTFRLWTPEETDAGLAESGCCSVDDVNDAKFVCHALGIPHYVFNYKDLFREKVVDYFVGEYRRGATPNPCIACNRHIKFDAFLDKALSMGFDFIATGHYATVVWDEQTGRYRLRRGAHGDKDQSYVLYCLTQRQLAHTRMPLGDLSKEEVRRIAQERGLVVSGKPDSQDICFVPDGDYGGFLERYTGRQAPAGDFLDEEGRVLGQHRGIWRYTIGQRKGLGVSFGHPMFVRSIDSAANTVTLGSNESLLESTLLAQDANWIDDMRPGQSRELMVKIRYSHKAQPARVTALEEGRVRVEFREPQRAVTAGQAVVFYDGDFVAGGATIAAAGESPA